MLVGLAAGLAASYIYSKAGSGNISYLQLNVSQLSNVYLQMENAMIITSHVIAKNI